MSELLRPNQLGDVCELPRPRSLPRQQGGSKIQSCSTDTVDVVNGACGEATGGDGHDPAVDLPPKTESA